MPYYRTCMDIHIFEQNKNAYLAYNNFRKQILSDLAPQDSEILLYMLPWMLNLNDPEVPGYVEDLEVPFSVFGLARDGKILKRESVFRNLLKIKRPLSLETTTPSAPTIHGLYTIGSIGTISQTSGSDCDIWICIDKRELSENRLEQLIQKINLIKDWLDIHVKIPAYFFICDLTDVRASNFGAVDRESAGSTQKNTLKEEFYRTMILIAGKIPLWWLCYDRNKDVDYAEFLKRYVRGDFHDSDCLDLGALDAVEREEYFGAALWLFNKALTHPLKSIIKMLLLEMLLTSPKHELLCHQFRSAILNREQDPQFIDPSTFTMQAILGHHQAAGGETFAFIKQCFYLRYEFKLQRKMSMKEIIAKDIFRRYPIPRPEIDHLNTFGEWPLQEQIRFGQAIFELLANIYQRVSAMEQGSKSSISKRDMNVIGRKLSVCFEQKPCKIKVFPSPGRALQIVPATFAVARQKEWTVSMPESPSMIAHPDIVYCIASLVWNGLYQTGLLKMTPNPTSITLQEINSLAGRIRDIFGVHDVSDIDFNYFTEPEKFTKMLLVVNFEGRSQNNDADDFGVVYKNHWGELFVRRFRSAVSFNEFIKEGGEKFSHTDIYYYVQRNALYYEKVIERTKMMVTQSFRS